LAKIEEFKSIRGIADANAWQEIKPDKYNDWVKQRDDRFNEYISMGDKKNKESIVVFENYSRGVATSRDAWCYNFSRKQLINNVRRMVDYYNSELQRYKAACEGLNKEQYPRVDDFISFDNTKIAWSANLKSDLVKGLTHKFQTESVLTGLYRPFTKSWVYFNKNMNERTYQMPRIFPANGVENRVICVTGRGETVGFSALITDELPNLHTIASGQCFPLRIYEPITEKKSKTLSLFDEENKYEQEKYFSPFSSRLPR
jgi:predicted helicase